jgi:hypothetical protein
MTLVRKTFLVRRLGWKVCDAVWHRDTLNTPTDDPRTVPVAAFADRSAAEARARHLDREARRLCNPFWSGNRVEWKTSLGESEFLSRLARLGIVPPPSSRPRAGSPAYDWWPWWEQHAHGWPEELFHAVWDLFDKVRFYDVAEVEMEG